ncbi:MAG: 4-hydroxythreonine-4-phosphate dehydrogenase PdxA [Pirellulaceae bacterium]|nr:4-hydroxythreonine-4-phosphate dehydrogenase PdxA [Pirellulaceae bacterium]
MEDLFPQSETSPPLSNPTAKPKVAITLGDPSGIGPEVVLGCWKDPKIHDLADLFVVGSSTFLKEVTKLTPFGGQFVEISSPDEVASDPQTVPVLECYPRSLTKTIRPCHISAGGGEAAYLALKIATDMALRGEIAALVTAPLHKEGLHLAGYDYPGHTEILADLCEVDDFAMMLYLAQGGPIRGPLGLGVVHVTLHTALRTVFEQISTEKILSKIRLSDRVTSLFLKQAREEGVAGLPDQPRIGICSLNPHGGEGGLFGDEEKTLIRPAVEQAQSIDISATGPLPTDTLMVRAAGGEFDSIVAMYHDQGHIALKLLGMHHAVNITLGLPIIRTSVAHGTAYDLAWQGKAETSSMVAAIESAAILARHQKTFSW